MRGPAFPAFLRRAEARIEAFLEAERGQLPLWFVAAFASGIAAWLWLPGPAQWGAFIILALGIALGGMAWGRGGLAARCWSAGWRSPRDAG